MPKYRKRPVVIWAEQWWPGTDVTGVCEDTDDCVPNESHCHTGRPHVHSSDGDHLVMPGDWIITWELSERSVCRDLNFRATYEAVE